MGCENLRAHLRKRSRDAAAILLVLARKNEVVTEIIESFLQAKTLVGAPENTTLGRHGGRKR